MLNDPTGPIGPTIVSVYPDKHSLSSAPPDETLMPLLDEECFVSKSKLQRTTTNLSERIGSRPAVCTNPH